MLLMRVLSKITQAVSKELNTVVVCTGGTDIISSDENTILVQGGSLMMTEITGTGCMLASLIGSFVAVNGNKVEAAKMAVKAMNIAGEAAYAKVIKNTRGSASYKVFLIDEIYTLNNTKRDEKD